MQKNNTSYFLYFAWDKHVLTCVCMVSCLRVSCRTTCSSLLLYALSVGVLESILAATP